MIAHLLIQFANSSWIFYTHPITYTVVINPIDDGLQSTTEEGRKELDHATIFPLFRGYNEGRDEGEIVNEENGGG